MSAGPTLPFATDRRALAAQMCHMLAQGAEDPEISLDQLGRVARQIAAFLLEEEAAAMAANGQPALRVIEGGRR